MKKLSIMLFILCLAPMMFGDVIGTTDQAEPISTFTVRHANAAPYNGPRAPAVLVDVIDISPINTAGYTWGLAYDWDRDGLWITQFSSTYNKMHCIQKTSPFTLIDSVTLGSGVPSYRLGIGYVGSNTMRMAAYSNTIYTINLTTGVGTTYRTLPWSGCEGLDANSVDDAIYASDWTANACAWAKPAQTGSWTTWSVAPYPSGMTGGYSATASPSKIFMVDEVTSGLAHIFQYAATAGVPNTTPESTWTVDASQTQSLTADAAFDGQYVYILDQSVPRQIFVYDVGIQMDDTVRWDFETGHQGWVNSNGQPFPGGWDVQSSQYEPAWSPPASDDSSYWVDSDAYGSLVEDTALSPVLVPHAATTKWFKYGFSFDLYAAGEFMEVGIKYFNGSAWTVVPLITYSADINPRWDSFDVSAYATYPRIQVYYYYSGDYGWWAAFDNVSLNGELYVASHDVATTAIVNPGQYVTPGVATAPQATYRNLGNNDETFNTYFLIDSAGTNVYTQMVNLTLVAGADSTVTYPNWMPGSANGINYALTAYTALAGDVNPANDTLHSTTMTQSAYWKIYASSVPLAVYYNSCAYAEPNGNQKVYSLANYTTSALTAIYEFDVASETWSTSSAVLNHGVARAAAATVNGKVYVMGGSTDLSSGLNYCQEFDPVAGTVTDRATLPTAVQFHTAAAWRDTLVYVLGGQSGSSYYNLVQIYNPATNAWTTGTAMPTTNRSFAMSISGDTIFFAGGYNGAYLTGSYIGVINPANPTQITWTAGPNIPTGPSGTPGRSRLQGAFVLGKFYFTGGDDHGVAAYDTWFWDPADNLWHQTLDKPTPISNSAAAVYVPFLDGGVFLCSGGYNTAGAAPTAACEGLINLGNAVEEKPGSPKDLVTFGFAPNMPNPVKNRVSLVYTTMVQGNVSLQVFDGTGRLVRDLSQGVQPAGTKTVVWDAKDNTGRDLQNGVYFVRLEANGRVASHKLVLVK